MGKIGEQLIDEVSGTEVPFGSCAFWWLGQHGFIVKLGKVVLVIDAYLSPSEYRNIPPLFRPEELTNASAILGTHDHSDHIDRPVWPAMAAASPQAKVIVPLSVRESVITEMHLAPERVVGLDDGLSTMVGDVKVSAVPAAHEFLSIDPMTGAHEFLGYVIEGNGVCLYHAGDTCIYEGMQAKLRQWKFDLALMPINGRDARRLRSNCIGNMTYQEAVDLAGTLRPGLTIPTHFEMFNGNTENPELFMDYLDAKYPGIQGQIPKHGELVVVQAS